MKKHAASAKTLDGTGIRIVSSQIVASDSTELQSLGEMLREEMKSGAVAVLGAKIAEDKVSLVAVVSDDLIKEKKMKAADIVGKIAEIVGGKGGGRPQLAQAGGKYPEKLGEALNNVEKVIRESLGN
jgi:alanyl-tRNA synthetase